MTTQSETVTGAEKENRILEHLWLVPAVYKKTAISAAIKRQKDDLIGEGNLGLMEAANCWKAGKSAAFKTFASRCIEKKMRAYLKREKRYYETHLPLSAAGAEEDGDERDENQDD